MSAKLWAVVPAAGRGSRFGAELPKQYLQLAGKAVIEHSLQALLNCTEVSEIVVALHPDDGLFAQLPLSSSPRISTVLGGEERCDSVLAALHQLQAGADEQDWVLVHDAARPCLSELELQALLKVRDEAGCGALLALPVVDTLKKAGVEQRVETTVDRSQLWRALTPQLFQLGQLRQALQHCLQQQLSVTDESSALELCGFSPRLIKGHPHNIKITYPQDLALAEMFLQMAEQESQS